MHKHSDQSMLDPLIRMLRTRVSGLVAIYLFGSFGTPDERVDSDIDLGLLADAPLEPVALFDFAGELATTAGREVDLVDMLACSTVMRARIISTGKLVYCQDAYRTESFATTTYSQYAHLNEARRGILQDIHARGSIHGR